MADIKITPTTLSGKLSAKITSDQLTIQQASVKSTPQSLSNAPRSVILRGEVQAQNNDGTTQIKTPRGTVTVRLETPLPRGQRVDIQLSSGTPPRDAIVQTATPRVQAQPTQPQQNQTTNTQPAPQTAPAQPAPSENIDGVKNLQTTAKQAAETIANTARQSVDPSTVVKTNGGGQSNPQTPRPVIAGQVVRLTPLPPNLQNPTALGQLVTQTNPQTLGTQLSNTINASSLLNAPLQNPNNAQQPATQNLFSQSNLTATGILKASSIIPSTNTLNLNDGATNIRASLLTNQAQPSVTDLRIITIQSPSGGNASLPSNTPALQIGQVLGLATGAITPSGNPIIQINVNNSVSLATQNPPIASVPTPQLFALNYPATNLLKGTQLVLQPTSNASNTAAASSQSWPALTDTLELLLSQLTPAQGQSLLNTVPRPASAGFQFTAAAMIFIAATRGGDIAGWMGGRADGILKAAGDKDNVASRLLRDIGASTGRPAGADAPPSIQNAPDWRGHTLPLLFGMEITKMNLWTKPFGDDESNNDTEQNKGMRFIVDLDLSRMGNVQLDGLIQPYAKRLDLALKTEQEFGSDTRTHIRGLWHNALTQIDMSGGIEFQTA
jgi:hypothetical protein